VEKVKLEMERKNKTRRKREERYDKNIRPSAVDGEKNIWKKRMKERDR
jgi:hypothetical protein